MRPVCASRVHGTCGTVRRALFLVHAALLSALFLGSRNGRCKQASRHPPTTARAVSRRRAEQQVAAAVARTSQISTRCAHCSHKVRSCAARPGTARVASRLRLEGPAMVKWGPPCHGGAVAPALSSPLAQHHGSCQRVDGWDRRVHHWVCWQRSEPVGQARGRCARLDERGGVQLMRAPVCSGGADNV